MNTINTSWRANKYKRVRAQNDTCNTDLRGSTEVVFFSDRQVWLLLHFRFLFSSYLTISFSLKLYISCILDCAIFEKNLGTVRADCPGPAAIMQKFNCVDFINLVDFMNSLHFHQESFTCRSRNFGVLSSASNLGAGFNPAIVSVISEQLQAGGWGRNFIY